MELQIQKYVFIRDLIFRFAASGRLRNDKTSKWTKLL